jgi:hypothetical protein
VTGGCLLAWEGNQLRIVELAPAFGEDLEIEDLEDRPQLPAEDAIREARDTLGMPVNRHAIPV